MSSTTAPTVSPSSVQIPGCGSPNAGSGSSPACAGGELLAAVIGRAATSSSTRAKPCSSAKRIAPSPASIP